MTTEPETPTAAQIPLQAFHLPEFPPEASHLAHLTLTSDIKPTDYASLLNAPLPSDAVSPSIPQAVESLTLELFSLGYPASFLTSLAKALPRLKALTVYCQLIDGISEASRVDAGVFMYEVLVHGLKELHLLDVFCRKGFLNGVGKIMEEVISSSSSSSSVGHDNRAANAMMNFLEISYTYRGHSDTRFLSRIPGDELPSLLVPSLIAASLKLAPSPAEQDDTGRLPGEIPHDPADVDEHGNRIPGRKPQGIIPFSSGYSGTALLVQRLTGTYTSEDEDEDEDGRGEGEASEAGSKLKLKLKLKMLDCTLYALGMAQLSQVLGFQTELAVLSASVLVRRDEQSKKALLDTMRSGSQCLEMMEIVGVPEEEHDNEEVCVCFFFFFFSVLFVLDFWT